MSQLLLNEVVVNSLHSTDSKNSYYVAIVKTFKSGVIFI